MRKTGHGEDGEHSRGPRRRHTWGRWRHGSGWWCAPQMGNLQIPIWGHLQMPPLQPIGKSLEGPPKKWTRLQNGLEGLQGSFALGGTWPSAKIRSAAEEKKARMGSQLQTSNARRGVGSCPKWTNKGLLNAPFQDASEATNSVKNGRVTRKIQAPEAGSCKVPTKGGCGGGKKGVVCVCVCCCCCCCC